MAVTVLFPDAVALTIGYLRDELEAHGWDAEVHSKVPPVRPDEFVLVFRTGGVTVTPVSDGAQLTVEAWAGSGAVAHDLAQMCRALLQQMSGTVVEGVAVYGVNELSGPADLPDPDSAQARYTFSVVASFRGAALPAGS